MILNLENITVKSDAKAALMCCVKKHGVSNVIHNGQPKCKDPANLHLRLNKDDSCSQRDLQQRSKSVDISTIKDNSIKDSIKDNGEARSTVKVNSFDAALSHDATDEILENLVADGKEIQNWAVRYAFDIHEGLLYAADQMEYRGFRSYGVNLTEDFYAQMKQSLETDNSDTMSIPEAEEVIQEMQYAAVTGNFSDVDSRDRQRFANWALFYPELRELFHAMHALTNNVDYSRTM